MANIKTVTQFDPTQQAYILPEKYTTSRWVDLNDTKQIGKIIKQNGQLKTIVTGKQCYHSPTALTLRKIFGSILCICTLGIAAAFKGVRNFFKECSVTYFAKAHYPVSPLLQIDVEGLFPVDKDQKLKLKERAERKTAAETFFVGEKDPFRNMHVKALVKDFKNDTITSNKLVGKIFLTEQDRNTLLLLLRKIQTDVIDKEDQVANSDIQKYIRQIESNFLSKKALVDIFKELEADEFEDFLTLGFSTETQNGFRNLYNLVHKKN